MKGDPLSTRSNPSCRNSGRRLNLGGATIAIAVALALPSTAAAAGACDPGDVDKTWDGSASTDWFENENWSPQGPNPPSINQDVCIPASAPNAPDIGTGAGATARSLESFKTIDVTAGSLELISATQASRMHEDASLTVVNSTLSNTGTLTIDEALNLGEASTLSGSGTTTIAFGATLDNDGGDVRYLDEGTLRIEGNATLAGDQDDPLVGDDFWMSNGATLEIASGGVLDLQHAQDIRWSGGDEPSVHILPGGRLARGTGLGLARISGRFDNDGIVDVLAGELQLEVDGVPATFVNYNQTTDALNSGTYVARNGATFSFPGAAIRVNSAEIALDGPGSTFEDLDGTDALATLRTNGSRGSVRLRNDGNLAVGGDLFNNGEIDIDTESELTTAGGFTQGSIGTLSVEASGITPGNDYGRIVAGGAVELDGRLDLRTIPLLQQGEFFDVVTSGDPRVGAFSEVSGAGFDVRYLLYRVRIAPPSLRIVNKAVSEPDVGSTNAAVRVDLSTPSEAAVAVDYRTVSNTAGRPADYTATSGRLTFPPGATSAFIQVPIKGDTLDEVEEDFTVQLDTSDPQFADVADGTATVTIQDNDPPPTISVSNVPNRIEGGANYRFDIALSAPSGRRVKVEYATVDGTAVAPGDYTAKDSLPPAPDTAPIVFRAGETQKVVSIVNVDDAIDEPLETFYLRVSDPMGATILDATGRTRIVDNDP